MKYEILNACFWGVFFFGFLIFPSCLSVGNCRPDGILVSRNRKYKVI